MSRDAIDTPFAPAASAGPAPLRVLTFTSLFPSVARPRHGIFVETRLSQLMATHAVDARVVAPVPWFPFRATAFGAYAKFAATPRRATRAGGLQVSHPRYLMLPKLGVSFQPESMARAAAVDIARLKALGWHPDLIDAHYLYPDGVAAALLAQRLDLPFVVTARGTDVNVLAHVPGPAQRIRWAAERAAAVITVSARLKEGLVGAGVSAAKITVLRNGVDLDLFRPEDPAESRRRLDLPQGRIAICVGHLLPEKGHALALKALVHMPGTHLVFAGDGPLRNELAALARKLGLESRVIFRTAMPQKELRYLYSCADVMLLTSTREGWPNVVLESLACGTPVATVDVGAVGEMLTRPCAGRIVPGRDPAALAAAAADLLSSPPNREQVRLHASQFDWVPTSNGQFEIMSRLLRNRPHA